MIVCIWNWSYDSVLRTFKPVSFWVEHIWFPLHFSVLAACLSAAAVSLHPVPVWPYTLSAFLSRFLGWSTSVSFPRPIYDRIPLELWPEFKVTFCSINSGVKSRKNAPGQAASSGAFRGHLRRSPLTSRVGSKVAASPLPVPCSTPVYWHLTQPVHTVLAELPGPSPRKFTHVYHI